MTNNLEFGSNEIQYLNFIKYIDPDGETIENLYDITLTAEEGGETSTTQDLNDIEKNTVIGIAAKPKDGFLFSKWLVDGVDNLINPLILNVRKNYNIVASFIQNALSLYLEVFNSVPVLKGNKYYYGDHSTKDNDVLIKNMKVGLFTVSSYVNSSAYLVGGQPLDLSIYFYYNAGGAGTTRTIFRCTGSGGKGLSIVIATTNYIQITQYNGGSSMVWNFTNVISIGWNKLQILWDGTTGGIMTSILTYPNGLVQSATNSGTFAWAGNSSEVIKLGALTSSYNSMISRLTIVNKLDWVFNHGQGSIIYDCLGNGNNGTVTGANLLTFWGTNSNDIVPYEVLNGATLYQNSSNNTIMPICYNKTEAIAGFNILNYYPPNSGVLKGLPNKYKINGCSPAIADGEYTADELSIINNPNVIIEQNANAITKIKVLK